MIDRTTVALFVRWLARIWGTLIVAFVAVFLGADVIGNLPAYARGAVFANVGEAVMFSFFPLGTLAGLAIAWRWERLGGAIATAAMAGLFVVRADLLANALFTVGIATPGVLYLVSGYLSDRTGRPGDAVAASTPVRTAAAIMLSVAIVIGMAVSLL